MVGLGQAVKILHMKKFIAVFVFSVLNLASFAAEDKLVKGCHPRLVFDSEEFKELKSEVERGGTVGKLHNHLMKVAEKSVKARKRFTAVRDASGKYIARQAAVRLISCSYAYRMTGEKQYREKVVSDLTDVCSLPDWGPKSFLDISEMAAAVSIAYDWLYTTLPKSLRKQIVKALRVNALEESRKNRESIWWYKSSGNWNQVCNSGLVCAAVAIYEFCPQLAQEVIDDAVQTNRKSVEGIYGPDGAYPEGATYWGYGSLFQVLMLTVLEDIFGTDYGISDAPGFLQTGLYRIFARGPKGLPFNYADSERSSSSTYPLFYFAYKRNEPSLLSAELELLERDAYRNSGHKCYMILPMKYAMKMKLDSLEAPSQLFYSAQGRLPLMMCRSGWGDDDHYLGAKGGCAGHLHGHMDGGMFVYYADGIPWAVDVLRESYNNIRPAFHAAGKKLFDMSQDSWRWRLFRYNCRQHNTLTVNDKNHNVKAFVPMTATEDTPERMSATFDLAPLFDGDLEKAERTTALCNGTHLEINDALKAPSDRPAHVRFTLMTMAKPEIESDGIRLTAETVSRKLRVEGGNVTYRIWSSDIEDYDYIIRINGKPLEAPIDKDPDNYIYICGYEIDIPAGEEVTLITTLDK